MARGILAAFAAFLFACSSDPLSEGANPPTNEPREESEADAATDARPDAQRDGGTERDSGEGSPESGSPHEPSEPEPTATVDGSVGGHSFPRMWADYQTQFLFIVNYPDRCEYQRREEGKASSTGLALMFASAIQPGSYTVGDRRLLFTNIGVANQQCRSELSEEATSGTLNIASDYSGTFNFVFPSGSLTGSFEATLCTASALRAVPPCVP